MKVSGFTLVRNGTRFDYPYVESLRSLLPLVDELVVNVGIGDDDTLERLNAFAEREGRGKVELFESRWPLDDPERKKGGLILSEQTNLALDRCTGDWCVYLQADEVLHEKDLFTLAERMRRFRDVPEVEGLLFDYVHFYGSFDVVQNTRSAYRREVRAFKRSSGARSVGDAQSFRKPDGGKLAVVPAGARVFHYGWVRTPESMREKTFFMDQLYHGAPDAKSAAEGVPHTGDNYRYKRFWGLEPYRGSHPGAMHERIRAKGWHWDLESSPFAWNWKDAKKVTLDLYERATGERPFEYRSYRLIEEPAPRLQAPRASLFVSTYDMPRHLDLVFAGIARQSFRDFEVLVCDDGSAEETRKLVERFVGETDLHVRHFWQEHRGFRKCRILNQAAREARGETLVFLDGDCVPHRDFMRDHVESQEPGRYLAGRRVELGQSISDALTPERVAAGYFDFPRPELLLSAWKGTEAVNRAIRLPWDPVRKLLKMDRVVDLKGCNYSIPRAALEAVNGFDEEYEGYGREDTDIELRLQHLGLRIKSLKGLALQFHVWHPRREFTPANDARLEELKRSGRIRCEKGLRTV
ncbi:MAG TPA: glycosyltransferase [Bdellovibrionota bacterium]|nr:glycosyltransferase [Bdellovibrionota bacterium]